MNYSPVVCFGFDRPMHLKRMLDSLEKNNESKDTIVYICVDGPTEHTDIDQHKLTLDVANDKNWKFKKTIPILRKDNYNCRTNIITTISELFQKHDRLIILEDDLIIGKYFLNYMNLALEKYKEEKNMWHINGYSYQQINNSYGSSISTYVSPWGWGTWKDRWEIFINEDFDKKNFISQLEDEEKLNFNLGNLYDWEDIIVKNEAGKISAWDAYWYQAIFLNDGYSLFPNKSHTQNEGFDGTGMHCSEISDWNTSLNNKKTRKFPNQIKVNRFFNFNTILFYRIYNLRRYFRYHADKFSSFENFFKFLRKKLKV